MPKPLTKPQEFKLFSTEAAIWLKKFGMVDWSVSVEEGDLEDDHCIACTVGDLQNRLLQISFNSKRTVEASRTEIRRAAFHECREALFWELRQMALYSFSFAKVDAVVHQIIILDENVFFS